MRCFDHMQGLQVWDLEALENVATLEGHCKPVLKLQYQQGLVFSIGGSSIRVWDPASGRCLERFLTTRKSGTLRALCVTPGLEMIVGCQDTTIKLYRFREIESVSCSRSENSLFKPPGGSMSSRDLHAAINSALHDIDSAPQAPIHASNGATAVSSDGQEVRSIGSTWRQAAQSAGTSTAGGADNGLARLRASAASAALHPIFPSAPGHLNTASLPQLQPSVSRVPYASHLSSSIALRKIQSTEWPVTEPAVTGRLDEGHCGAVQSVVHSDKYIVSGGGDCRIRVWDKGTLAHVCALSGHRGPIFTLVVVGARLRAQMNT
jgi:WD40 repeat protein